MKKRVIPLMLVLTLCLTGCSEVAAATTEINRTFTNFRESFEQMVVSITEKITNAEGSVEIMWSDRGLDKPDATDSDEDIQSEVLNEN